MASPPVRFTSEAEARDALRARFERDRPEEPDFLALGLSQFGLTQPSGLEPATRAELLAATWSAYYDSELEEVVVIDREGALDSAALGALVVHELIHALQDRDHDLEAFARLYRVGSDGDLRASCVVEGEARLHEQRYWAALSGSHTELPTGPQSFRASSDALEAALLEAADVYSTSRLQVPYAHGAAFAESAWRAGGHAAVSALMVNPPSSMREILAASWGAPGGAAGGSAPELVTEPPLAATLEAWTPLGAWGVYLIARLEGVSVEEARPLALDWSGDRFEVYSTSSGEPIPRWTLRFAAEDAAGRFSAALSARGRLDVTASGSLVVLDPR